MARFTPDDLHASLARLRWPLRLTWAGMWAETLVQSLWPFTSLILLGLAALMMGVQDALRIEIIWGIAVLLLLLGGLSLLYAGRHLRRPGRAAALARLDASLPGRPISALLDEAAIGQGDADAMALWRAHQRRMAERAARARGVPGDLRIARRDPYALRYVALLAFAVALMFGSFWRISSVADMAPGGGPGLAGGPVWEGWAEPPRYTGKPTLYLNDQKGGSLTLPEGTLVTLRLYGEVGALGLSETVSGRGEVASSDNVTAQDFAVRRSGEITVSGPGGQSWDVVMLPDASPRVSVSGAPEVSALGETRLPFSASDDYGVAAGEARIRLDLASVERRYGLSVAPEPRPEILVPLPTPIAGDRRDFEENLIEDFSKHPWANLPVRVSLSVLDAAEQIGRAEPAALVLPGRRFFDPLAAAVIEMRRDLLWSRDNARRITQVLKAVTHLPEDIFRSQTLLLRLRRQIERLELRARFGLDEEVRAEIAEELWGLAIEIEEGVLADALERMRRAQERLGEAMKNGASDEEIAQLMDELRQATEEYLRQLRRQQAEKGSGQEGQQPPGDSMQMTQDDLQRMMDRIQQLMEEGRMAEAEQALREFQEMMENMRVTEGQPGEAGQSPGEQAMEGLSDTLREQQGLSDQAFRDLQEQFNPGANAGESQGNEGRDGGQGRGQQHDGQNGQGQGSGDPQQGRRGAQDGDDGAEPSEEGLAERQRALREELKRQQGQLPGQASPEGRAARDALGRAGRAMDSAEQALRDNDLPGAIDNQAQAMEALREGMRALGEAMAQEERDGAPGQGTAEADRRSANRDPLGREQGGNGASGSDAPLAEGENGQDRARRLLDEIRRRSGETARPEVERDYLKRLLERF
ncbi:TIGR02302 family protein [Sulfitobacter aestuarii]|uniref:TIGR02302 family protein n=1 Tax=Sulfitobacter aestuarii TaxID=2161676 RepID=A0ABW5U4X2_9RHOB